jgi:nucleoside-diphosphate-sugar epimerase
MRPVVDLDRSLDRRPVAVTGAAGFVGANLCERLAAQGHAVVAWVRPGSSPRSAWRRPALAGCDVREVDLLDRHAVSTALGEVSPQVVVHAARGDVAPSAPWNEAASTSLDGTANLLAAIGDSVTPPRLVHLGSSLELRAADRPLREDDPIGPDSRLGEIKAAEAERVRAHFAAGGHGAILRVFSVYGPWEAPHRLIPTAIRCLRESAPLSLTAPGFRRDWIHVDDVVAAILLASAADAPDGEFHVGTGVEHDSDVVVQALARHAGRSLEIRRDHAPHATDRSHWCADPERARTVLGWRARIALDEGLGETLRWWNGRSTARGRG